MDLFRCYFIHFYSLQIHREFRKPLIVMSPKNLLRHKDCRSNLSEFDDVKGHPGFDKQGTRFKRLIMDQNLHSDREEGIRRLILCSGKVSHIFDFNFLHYVSIYFLVLLIGPLLLVTSMGRIYFPVYSTDCMDLTWKLILSSVISISIFNIRFLTCFAPDLL